VLRSDFGCAPHRFGCPVEPEKLRRGDRAQSQGTRCVDARVCRGSWRHRHQFAESGAARARNKAHVALALGAAGVPTAPTILADRTAMLVDLPSAWFPLILKAA
jgi:hypothetical protein